MKGQGKIFIFDGKPVEDWRKMSLQLNCERNLLKRVLTLVTFKKSMCTALKTFTNIHKECH